MERIHTTEMKQCIDALIKRGAFTNAFVLVFGHCNATEETIEYLMENGIVVEAILDNSVSKQRMDYRNIPIVSPTMITKHPASHSIVLIATRFFAQMSAQLRRLGYEGEIFQVVEYNSFSEYSLSDETFARKYTRMERGAATLSGIRKRFPAQHLFVCPNDALGDVYWAMSFLPAYCKTHGISEVVVIEIGGGCQQVAEMFDVGNIITLERTEMDELVQALIFTREPNCIIPHHDRPYTDNIIQWLGRHFLSFIDYYRLAVYGLPQDTAPVFPTVLRPYAGAGALMQGKTLILAPYAKSVIEAPVSFWEQLAARYTCDGYMVCTSVNGDEQPIPGTTPLHISLNQIQSAVEYAGCFIGLRSGLCDIVHTANCRKIVVFPNCYYSSTSHKVEDFFALPGWESIRLD